MTQFGKDSVIKEVKEDVVNLQTAQSTLANDKVDKVSGRGLSEENFTASLKNKLDNLPTSAAPLDVNGKVPAINLPSYVDDVEEYVNIAGFPVTGETGKIYVDLATSKIYRWSGTVYVEISPSPASTDSVTEGSTNLYFTNTRAKSAVQADLDDLGDRLDIVEAHLAAIGIKRTETHILTTDGNSQVVVNFGTAVSNVSKVAFVVDTTYDKSDHPVMVGERAISTTGATLKLYRSLLMALLGNSTIALGSGQSVRVRMIEFI